LAALAGLVVASALAFGTVSAPRTVLAARLLEAAFAVFGVVAVLVVRAGLAVWPPAVVGTASIACSAVPAAFLGMFGILGKFSVDAVSVRRLREAGNASTGIEN
jgi:hypothetical protein